VDVSGNRVLSAGNTPMRIAIDGTPLLTPKSGVGKYTVELSAALKRLPEAPKVHLAYGIFWPKRFRKRKAPVGGVRYDDGLHHGKRFRWISGSLKKWIKESILKLELSAISPDIYHAPNFAADAFGVPLIITVHDLSYLRYPDTLPPERLAWFTKHFPRYLHAARHIIAVSEFTKNEIVSLLGVSEKRITAVHNGVSQDFKPMPAAILADKLKPFHLEPKKYILSVGTIEPRKNLLALIKAYALLPESIKSNWPLVIAGMLGWKDQAITKGIEALTQKGTVKPIGYVPDRMLPFLYAGAALFVYPSLYEGFGLPPLEAMASGVPVMVSNRSSLPEVVGETGVFIDPEDIESMAQKMIWLLKDSQRCEQMVKSGLERAKRFTWYACAEKTYRIYQRVLAEKID